MLNSAIRRKELNKPKPCFIISHPITFNFSINKSEVIMSTGKKQTLSISLPTEMIDWLDSSAKSQSLPSQSKAVRCCVNCVALGDVDMIRESNDASAVQSSNYQALNIELAIEQIEWVDSVCSKSEGSSQSEVVRSVIKACMNAEADVVFGVVRCKSKVTACEGAQNAVASLTERNGANGVVVKEDIELL